MLALLLQAGGGSAMTGNLVLIGGIIVIFYFFMIRPQQKKQKDQKKFLDEIKLLLTDLPIVRTSCSKSWLDRTRIRPRAPLVTRMQVISLLSDSFFY